MNAPERTSPHQDGLRARTLLPGQEHGALTRQMAGIALGRPGAGVERPLLLLGLALLGVFAVSIGWLLVEGVGIWGLDQQVYWGFDIASYVWWIGLGNAGAVISALLLLMRHNWRNSLNRLAETMTLLSAVVAGLFPVLHLGRPELVYWVFPVHVDDLGLWPQFRSPLAWDAFAVLTYLGVVGLFWYVGLIPDLAALRDRARRPFWAGVYGVLALGWRASSRQWAVWRRAYRTIAALALPYVVVIHAGVALLFAGGPVSGWHSTIFPTLFMIGGTLAGFAVVALLAVLLRAGFNLGNVLTRDHLDLLSRIILALALAYLYCHIAEIWTIYYRHDAVEVAVLEDRLFGGFALLTWAGWIGSIGLAQLFWVRRLRRSPVAVALVSAVIAAAIYAAHLVLIVSVLARGHFPALWRSYDPTLWEWGLLAGSAGLFLTLLLLLLRALPPVSIFEIKQVLHEEGRAP